MYDNCAECALLLLAGATIDLVCFHFFNEASNLIDEKAVSQRHQSSVCCSTTGVVSSYSQESEIFNTDCPRVNSVPSSNGNGVSGLSSSPCTFDPFVDPVSV